jgi:tetratricopeptide (TPR) repeat protein
MRGYWTGGREHLAALLALPGAKARTVARATALSGAGVLTQLQGDLGAARALHEESLAISRELGNKREVAWSLWCLGRGERLRGEYEAARTLFEESLAIFRELGYKEGIAHSLANLGIVAHHQGHSEAAGALLVESLAMQRALDNKHGIGWSLHSLGKAAHDQRDYGTSRALFEESLAILLELVEKDGIVMNLEGLAAVAVAQAQPERAARLFGAAEGLREAIGALLHPAECAQHDSCVAAARAALGEEAFAAAWAEGRAMSPEDAIGFALEKMRADVAAP